MNFKAALLIILTVIIDITAISFGYMVLWIFGVFLTLLLIFSAVMIALAKHSIEFNQIMREAAVAKGMPAYLTVQFINKSIFLYPYVHVKYKNGGEEVIPVYPGQQTVNIEYVFNRKGRYQVGINSIIIYDAFGIFCRKIQNRKYEILCVMPVTGIYSGGAAYEADTGSYDNGKRKKLEDKSSVSFLREYRYGDTLNSINWKATARHAEVIVNQHENELCPKVFIYVGKSSDADLDDYVCGIALTRVRYILDSEGSAALFYSGNRNVLENVDADKFYEYGIYLSDMPEDNINESSFMENDSAVIERAVFEKENYNYAIFYLQYPMSAGMERIIHRMENLHIKTEVHQPPFADDPAGSMPFAAFSGDSREGYNAK